MVNIREIELKDVEEVSILFNDYRLEYDMPPDILGCKMFLEERIRNQQMIMYLAELEGKCVGFIQVFPTFSSVSLKKIFILTDLYVVPSYRKQGIAKMLIQKTKNLATDVNEVGLVIESRISSQSAQRLYDSVGFKKDGEHLYYYLE